MLIKVKKTLCTYNPKNQIFVYSKKFANENKKHFKIKLLPKKKTCDYKTRLLNARLEFVLSKLNISKAELIKFLQK